MLQLKNKFPILLFIFLGLLFYSHHAISQNIFLWYLCNFSLINKEKEKINTTQNFIFINLKCFKFLIFGYLI